MFDQWIQLLFCRQSLPFRSPARHRILFVSTGQPRFGDEVFATTLDKQLASLKRRSVEMHGNRQLSA